jgi:4-amino-4-deoxy-L-arabinose transferase-like glycosyltransferase
MKKLLYKIIIIMLIIFTIIASICALFNVYNSTSDVLNPLVIIIGVIVGILVNIKLYKLLNNMKDSKIHILAIILAIIFFISLSTFGINHLIIPGYDLSHIERELNLMMTNGPVITNIDYFAKYTNQIPLTIILYYIYFIGKILQFGNLKVFATIINSLGMAVSAFLTYLTVKDLKNAKLGLIALIFFIINPVFYMYASYFYTDTLCLPFASLAIYLFIKERDKSKKKSIMLLLITGATLAIGTKIRVVVAILLIAMIMTTWINNKSITILIKKSLLLIIGFMIGIFSFSLISNQFDIPEDTTKEFPIYHWIMMGLNDNTIGRYNGEDHAYTKSGETLEIKKEKDIKEIKSRLNKLGIPGLIKLIAKKICITWSNGAYRYIDKINNVENITFDYEYVAGNNIKFILYYMQICKSMVLVLFLYLLIRQIKHTNDDIKFIIISLFGAFLFYIIWEVQARYSLSFLPWMIILFPFSIESLTNIKINNINIKRIVPIIILIITIILLGIGYKNNVLVKSNHYDTRVSQEKTRGHALKEIHKKEAIQSFKVKGKFNIVSIKFLKYEETEESNYMFILYDENMNIINEQIFSSNDVTNEKFKKFKFETINANNETYYVEIKCLDNVNHSLEVASFNYDPYTAYPNGILTIDGDETTISMAFKVQYKIKRSNTTSIFYIILTIIIISLELFAFVNHKKSHQ